MRKLILQMQMSADGFVAAADPTLDWQVWDWGPDWTWDRRLKRDFNKVFASIDCILLSRPMAEEGYSAHWAQTAQAHVDDLEYAFARKIVSARKVVFSKTLQQPPFKEMKLARESLTRTIRALKRAHGKNLIAFGGTGLASSLIDAKAVDEFQFFVNPVVLGDGDSIFSGRSAGLALKLIQSTAYSCGIVVQRYAPAWDDAGPNGSHVAGRR